MLKFIYQLKDIILESHFNLYSFQQPTNLDLVAEQMEFGKWTKFYMETAVAPSIYMIPTLFLC